MTERSRKSQIAYLTSNERTMHDSLSVPRPTEVVLVKSEYYDQITENTDAETVAASEDTEDDPMEIPSEATSATKQITEGAIEPLNQLQNDPLTAEPAIETITEKVAEKTAEKTSDFREQISSEPTEISVPEHGPIDEAMEITAGTVTESIATAESVATTMTESNGVEAESNETAVESNEITVESSGTVAESIGTEAQSNKALAINLIDGINGTNVRNSAKNIAVQISEYKSGESQELLDNKTVCTASDSLNSGDSGNIEEGPFHGFDDAIDELVECSMKRKILIDSAESLTKKRRTSHENPKFKIPSKSE